VDRQTYDRGREIRTAVLGEEHVRRAADDADELRTHLKGAVTNGVTRDEIREVFLQVAIYGGVPASVDSFRIAREVLEELDAQRLVAVINRYSAS
jgi:4-carboxymuconolactone decarboxylase